MTEQPSEGLRYTQYVTVTILTCLVAQSIGLLIGTVAPSLPVCLYLFFYSLSTSFSFSLFVAAVIMERTTKN